MKLSTRARYALASMLAISRLEEGNHPVSLGLVAQKTQISKRYLEQLVIALKNASLLRGISGRGGGYLLSRKPSEIRIGEIIEAAIGPVNIVDCVLTPDVCLKSDFCECRMVYALMNKRITEVLNEFTLADMDDKAWTNGVRKELSEDSPGSGIPVDINLGELTAGLACSGSIGTERA